MVEKLEYKNITKLTGSSNYTTWENKFLKIATLENWYTTALNENNQDVIIWSTAATKVKEIKTYFAMTISDDITDYDLTKSVREIINDLRMKFGTSYINHEEYVSNIETKVWFNQNLHPYC